MSRAVGTKAPAPSGGITKTNLIREAFDRRFAELGVGLPERPD